jgi:hypothetical protein
MQAVAVFKLEKELASVARDKRRRTANRLTASAFLKNQDKAWSFASNALLFPARSVAETKNRVPELGPGCGQAKKRGNRHGANAARSEPSSLGIIDIPEKHDATEIKLHRFELDFLAHVGGGGPTGVGPI